MIWLLLGPAYLVAGWGMYTYMCISNALRLARAEREHETKLARWHALPKPEQAWRSIPHFYKPNNRFDDTDRSVGVIFWPIVCLLLGVCAIGRGLGHLAKFSTQAPIERFVRWRLGAAPDPLALASEQELETELQRRNALKEPT